MSMLFLVINNENLIDLYKDLNFFNAFGKADDTLANAHEAFPEIISEPCYVNVDFRDVKTTLKGAGTAIISTAEGRVSTGYRMRSTRHFIHRFSRHTTFIRQNASCSSLSAGRTPQPAQNPWRCRKYINSPRSFHPQSM